MNDAEIKAACESYRKQILDACKKDILRSDDGFYHFATNGGLLSEYALRTIADHLEELNAPWHAKIEEYFALHGKVKR